jgi:ATP-dependent Clp protease ATP-binding subunit ClpA
MNCLTLLRATIRPEFLNRIDEIIMFTPLSRDEITDIVKLQFKQVQQTLAEMGSNHRCFRRSFGLAGTVGLRPAVWCTAA